MRVYDSLFRVFALLCEPDHVQFTEFTNTSLYLLQLQRDKLSITKIEEICQKTTLIWN